MDRKLKFLLKARRGMIALALISLVSVALVACGDDDDDDAGTTATPDDSMAMVSVGDLDISGAYTRESVNDVAAVYLTIKNNGAEDTLLSASADVGTEAQIHEVVGSAMQEVPGGVDIPANGEVTFAPGGYHIMVLGLGNGLQAGSTIHVDLTFEKAGSVTLEVPVKSLDEAGGMDMGDGTPTAESEG